ncbi:bifunctional lysine-specific demethylase and histidyl-hydroxylase NO66 [Anopheles coustani]|uniref:bifunctional lysine-specific demethylase and histidyl-hydroxylase NO66 n=2 Tax=coustani group TaxID=59130 RepID=UPI00265A98F6|nr:bifunctional lysine-specific demethylase and histidyl-hydroxylase NO66 [Anopheles coustani]
METVVPVVVAESAAVEGMEGASSKKPPQKRKKPASSPVAGQPPGTPTPASTKMKAQMINEIMEEMNEKLGTEEDGKTDQPAKKKQKNKHTTNATDMVVTSPAGSGVSDGGKKQKKPAKQVRFQIKLYPTKTSQPQATSAAAIAKKKKAKQQTTPKAQPKGEQSGGTKGQRQQQNGATDAKKPPTKRNRSKANASKPATPASNGAAQAGGEYVLPPPTSNFTPIKIKQEPKTPQGKLQRPAASTPVLPAGMPNELDSVTIGRHTFGWLIGPITVEEFMGSYWERKPLLVQRNDRQYYAGLLSRAMIDEMLRTNNVEYTKNIDITSYVGGQRETHNPDGRVLPPDMWHFYGEGCSVRMLNPQTYLRSIYELNVKLQEYFHCMTGANFYLTPPNSQGFAPHYDDIEAFVLQVEGRKRWRLYPARQPQETLARVSSENLSEEELATPLLDVVLEAGDLLYFPRGCIHQAATVPGAHSLHVTLSVYQRNCWADLFEQMLPLALASAAEENQQLREGLPLDLHHHFGIVHSDEVTTERRRLIVRIRAMFDKLFSDTAIDAAVDQLAKRFQHDALPPLVDYTEWNDTVYGAGNYEFRPDGTVECVRPIEEQSSVRLLRRNILRLVSEEDKLRIYYHTDNSREYHQYEANFLELDHETALGVELLIKMYPRYIPVASLPVEDRLEFIRSLWEKGLIVCRRPAATAAATDEVSSP